MNSRNYCIIGALAASVSVITTLGIHGFLEGPSTFEEALQVYQTPYYIFTKAWVILHCIVVIISMYALSKFLQSQGSIYAGLGFVFYAGFGFFELFRMTLVLGYLGQLRTSFLSTDDEMLRQILQIEMDNFAGIGQGLFFAFIICFIVGNLITGLCCISFRGLYGALGYVLVFWGIVSTILLINEFVQVNAISNFGNYFSLIFQPSARILVAITLFSSVKNFVMQKNDRSTAV